MQEINLDFIKKNHTSFNINNKNNNNNSNINEKKNNKLLKDIKFYKKRIKEYNNQLLNNLINNSQEFNNLNNKHVELYKTYLENLIKYFKFTDAEILNQKELENYNNNDNYYDISINKTLDDTNKLFNYKLHNNNSIKNFCNTNKIYEEPKILPKKKIIVKYNGKDNKKKTEVQ